jgi:hypothetical protein
MGFKIEIILFIVTHNKLIKQSLRPIAFFFVRLANYVRFPEFTVIRNELGRLRRA